LKEKKRKRKKERKEKILWKYKTPSSNAINRKVERKETREQKNKGGSYGYTGPPLATL